jgi:hypothetical protein
MTSPAPGMRRRLGFVVAAIATIGVGLFVHTSGGVPPTIKDVSGDALWALMVYCWLGALLPRTRVALRASFALGIAWTVELTQLYHAPWIDSMRSARIAHLVLGSDFDARDLVAYALGILVGAISDVFLKRRTEN